MDSGQFCFTLTVSPHLPHSLPISPTLSPSLPLSPHLPTLSPLSLHLSHSPPHLPPVDPQQQVQLPRILLQPNDLTILRGNPYNLECVGLPTGGNTSQITFLNNRNLVQGALRSFFYPDPPMGFPIYRIESVSFSDQSGCYFCQITDATTRISFETRKATLTVHCK